MKKGNPRRPRPILPYPFDPTLALVQLTKGYFAIISAVDVEAVGKYNWSAAPRRLQTYAERKSFGARKAEHKTILLHRFIGDLMGLPQDREIDHRGVNGLDCSRSNLRAATHAQNAYNVGAPSHNKSGIKGVSWDGERKKWVVAIKCGEKRVHRRFGTIAEAAEFAHRVRDELHAEFSNRGVH